jgi:hypothetical protein
MKAHPSIVVLRFSERARQANTILLATVRDRDG